MSDNYPGEYENGKTCEINGVSGPLQVVSFDVEASGDTCPYDYLEMIVGGVPQRFCGSYGPEGMVPDDGKFSWVSDASVTMGGWKVCWETEPSPGSCLSSCFTLQDECFFFGFTEYDCFEMLSAMDFPFGQAAGAEHFDCDVACTGETDGPACSDTDFGATDSYGDGCAAY